MSKVEGGKVRVGNSVTPANNFEIDTSADDGTMVLKREDGTEVLSVDALGNLIGKGADPVDTTLDRLMQVADFGYGSGTSIVVSAGEDLDDFKVNGNYEWGGSSPINAPAASANSMMKVCAGIGGAATTQLVFDRDINSIYMRSLVSGVWGVWDQTFNQGNILGTVSESGGVPTGAILESGSNANGTYTKYADGTLICRFMSSTYEAHTTAVGSLWQGPSTIMDFPSTFIVAPEVTMNADLLTEGAWGYNLAPSTTQVQGFVVSTGNTGTARLGYIAIGRWF